MSSCLHVLRSGRAFARMALAWFVLSLGVAVASPLVSPQAMEWICSGGAAKLVVKTDEGARDAPPAHAFECPLCLLASAPPPSPVHLLPVQLPQALAWASPRLAQVAARTAAPLSARAPPTAPVPRATA